MLRIFKMSAFGIGIVILCQCVATAQEIWVGKDGNIRNANTRALLINGGELYLATNNEVYKARDSKGRWESVFFIPSGNNEISCLGGKGRNLFIGTKRGLFRSQDLGASWRNVFRTIMPDKNNILAIEVSDHNPKRVVITTKSGIFYSEDTGDNWTDISANLKDTPSRCIALNKESMYAGGDSGLYVRRPGASGWERLIVNSSPERSADEEGSGSADDIEKEEPLSAVNCVKIKGDTIYAGVDRKILYSGDGGKVWKDFPKEGLGGAINYILPSLKDDRLYCATTRGVFEFSKDKSAWFELYKGLDKNVSVAELIFDNGASDSLWAVTDKGLYRLEGGDYMVSQHADIEKSLKQVKATFSSEPTFQELQEAAIRYAEVSPEKIKKWRREARLRALVPKVSFSLDNNRSTNSEIYTSATREYVIAGPDDIQGGWDVSVAWELGDLIWSDDQTNIDVRSRLMVQLRNDILDDLRRAYYERKRTQFELMTEPPKDVKARFDKEMRLKELTSQIDDLTGNYLSARIKESED